MSGNLFTGAGYFLRGLTMTFQPGLRRFVLIPLIANIVLFSLMGWLLYGLIVDFYEAAMLTVPEWLQFLSWIITPLLWLIGGLMTGYVSTLIVLMLTTFTHCSLKKSRRPSPVNPFPHWMGSLQRCSRCPGPVSGTAQVLYYVPMAIGVLILTIVPLFNAFGPWPGFYWARGRCLQFVDYPMDNHRLAFRDVRDACAARRLSTIGFGGTVAFFTGIPLLNLIVIPAAVIGATLLWCEELRPRR